MQQELTATGKTVAEAVESACAQLGLSPDDVVYEILEEAHGGFLGIGAKPAKVKAWPREDEISGKSLLEEMDRPKTAPQPERRESAEKPRFEQRGKQEKKQPAQPQPQRESYPFKPVKEASPAPAPEAEPVRAAIEPEETNETEIALSELPESAKGALEYIKGIAPMLGANDLQYRAVKTERGVKLAIDGGDASAIIGRRGETMDALQYLCTLVSSRTDDEYCKITLDVAGYRKKREKTLQALAQREAAKVKKSKYSATLDPMNPYERRIVHSAVQLIDGVTSESVGEEPYRRVVISLTSGGKTPRRDSRGPRYGKGGPGRGGRGYDRPRRDDDRRDARRDDAKRDETKRDDSRAGVQTAAPGAGETKSAEKKNEGGGTLYAKIEL